MMGKWRQLSTITNIFYIGYLISFIGLAIMILTRHDLPCRHIGTSQALPILYVTHAWGQ